MVHGKVEERLFLVEVSSALSIFESKSLKSTIKVFSAYPLSKFSLSSGLQQINKRLNGFLLVVDKEISDLPVESLVLKLLLSVDIIEFNLHLLKVDLVDLDGILPPLPTKVLLVYCKESSVLSNFY